MPTRWLAQARSISRPTPRRSSGGRTPRWWNQYAPETPVIVITAFGTVGSAVEAMKLGAADYLGKPLSSPDELRLLVARNLEKRRLANQVELLRQQESNRFAWGAIIAEDPKMKRVLEMAHRVAPTATTVLLTGKAAQGRK